MEAEKTQNKNNVVLLKEKVENSIVQDKSIVAYISSPILECRNTICIEDYEIDNDMLYINNNNFELHIKLECCNISYVNEMEECFIIKYDNLEIGIMV